MTIAGRALLSCERRTVRTVNVQNALFDRLAVMNFIHPLTRMVHQGFEVLWLCENFRFKSSISIVEMCTEAQPLDSSLFRLITLLNLLYFIFK